MGKSVKLKQRQAEQEEAKFRELFSELSAQAAYRPPPDPLEQEFQEYREHFIRPPDTFRQRTRSSRREKQVAEMARHLFGKYRVPRVLEQVWAAYLEEALRPDVPPRAAGPRRPLAHRPTPRNVNLRSVDFRAWYVCVATGGSLYKEHTKGFLSKRETHEFLSSPVRLGLCEAVIHAVARAAGAENGVAQRLARSKAHALPFTPFWFDAIRFFSQPDHVPDSLQEVDDLLDYLAHRRQEDPSFRLLGSSQSLPALRRRMEEWHRSLARAKDLSGVTWPGVDIPDATFKRRHPENKQRTLLWKVSQITTGNALAKEGSAMRHCVYSYKHKCVNGLCSIWSLTSEDEVGKASRHLTIEVSQHGDIVQARGLANRLPRPEERNIVSIWARERGLSYRGF